MRTSQSRFEVGDIAHKISVVSGNSLLVETGIIESIIVEKEEIILVFEKYPGKNITRCSQDECLKNTTYNYDLRDKIEAALRTQAENFLEKEQTEEDGDE